MHRRGQLGLSGAANALGSVATPILAHSLFRGWEGLNVSKIATAHYDGEYTIVLTSDGRVFSFGDCEKGMLGIGSSPTNKCDLKNCQAASPSISCNSEPVQLAFPAGAGSIIDIGAGDDFALAADVHGNVYGWGQANDGLVGNGCCRGAGCAVCTGGQSTNGGQNYNYYSPVASTELNVTKLGSRVLKIHAGSNFVVVQVENGRVYGLGMNNNGQLGTAG